MNGVVLWSDARRRKAVIWCEDQGDLAFYSQNQRQGLVDLHEGDLICFDLSLQQSKRMAENPQVLEEAACVGLAQSLSLAKPDAVKKAPVGQFNAQVIPMSTWSNQKLRNDLSRSN